MKVDHVLPESYSVTAVKTNALRERLGLPSSFDFLGYENLAPSCDECNSRKTDLLLVAGYIAIILAKISSRIKKIQELLEERRIERDLDNTLRRIARSIEANKFSADDLLKGLDFLRKFPDGIHASSPTAPPRSPEQAIAGLYISDTSRILWTKHAAEAARDRGLNLKLIQDKISQAANEGSLKVKRLNDIGSYQLRAGLETRIEFKVDEDKIIILTAYRKQQFSC